MTRAKSHKTKQSHRKKQQAAQAKSAQISAVAASSPERGCDEQESVHGATSTAAFSEKEIASKKKSSSARFRSCRCKTKSAQVTRATCSEESVKKRLQESYHEKADQIVSVRGHEMEKGSVFKIFGLVAFAILMVIIIIALWPIVKELSEPDGFSKVIVDVQSAGVWGVLILLGMQFLQIVVAFIPGEMVQVAAGMMYGPWWGALIIFLGCVISSMFIFEVVHRLGAPFVQSMVPAQYMEKFRNFEKSGKLSPIVFMLFFIPGLPKDVFTYLVPLTDMSLKSFILLSCVARIPGIVVSTYAADSLAEGNITESVIIFAAVGIVALIVLIFRNKLMGMLERFSKHGGSKTNTK